MGHPPAGTAHEIDTASPPTNTRLEKSDEIEEVTASVDDNGGVVARIVQSCPRARK
jgi:hypothetical protein